MVNKLNITSHNRNFFSSFLIIVSEISPVVYDWILCAT